MAKILLVCAPFEHGYLRGNGRSEHLGLGYLASFARDAGHQVDIVDLGAESYCHDSIPIDPCDVDIVGFTVYSRSSPRSAG